MQLFHPYPHRHLTAPWQKWGISFLFFFFVALDFNDPIEKLFMRVDMLEFAMKKSICAGALFLCLHGFSD